MAVEIRSSEPLTTEKIVIATQDEVGRFNVTERDAYQKLLNMIRQQPEYVDWAIMSGLRDTNVKFLELKALLAPHRDNKERILEAGLATRLKLGSSVDFTFHGYGNKYSKDFLSGEALIDATRAHFKSSIIPASVKLIDVGPIR
jgi:hypothetical protein